MRIEGPAGLAADRVERDDLVVRGADIERAVGVQRRGLSSTVPPFGHLRPVKSPLPMHPDLLQLPDVGDGDLRERRILAAAGIAAEGRPVATGAVGSVAATDAAAGATAGAAAAATSSARRCRKAVTRAAQARARADGRFIVSSLCGRRYARHQAAGNGGGWVSGRGLEALDAAERELGDVLRQFLDGARLVGDEARVDLGQHLADEHV